MNDKGAAVVALKSHVGILDSTYQGELCMAGAAIKAVGRLLFASTCDDVELTRADIEGLHMTVEVLGDHIENLSGDIDQVATDLRVQIKLLEGKS